MIYLLFKLPGVIDYKQVNCLLAVKILMVQIQIQMVQIQIQIQI